MFFHSTLFIRIGNIAFWKTPICSLGQLIRENNKALDKTFIYCYDGIGNITSVKEYSYTAPGTDVPSYGTTRSFSYHGTYKDRLDRLRRLDRRATERAEMYSITLGIIGTLIMGFGMSLCMTELSLIFGDKQWLAMMTGVSVGLIGCALVALAYPVYNLTLKRERKRIAPEIIRLTDELMK